MIGIGINLNQNHFPPDLPNPTSFKRLTGRTLDLPVALDRFLACFTALLPGIYSDTSSVGIPSSLLARYEASLFQKGIPRPYRDLSTGEVFTGIIRGVSPDGRLIVAPVTLDGNEPFHSSTVISSGGEAAVEKTFGFKDIGYII